QHYHLYRHNDHRNQPPFPTRRSSDLVSANRHLPTSLLGSLRKTPAQVLRAASANRFRVAGRRARWGKNTWARKTPHLGRLTPERSEEHTSELQSRGHLVCRLLLEKKK